jgi:hypothetical protein
LYSVIFGLIAIMVGPFIGKYSILCNIKFNFLCHNIAHNILCFPLPRYARDISLKNADVPFGLDLIFG